MCAERPGHGPIVADAARARARQIPTPVDSRARLALHARMQHGARAAWTWGAAIAIAIAALPAPSRAFTTRVHIVLANEVRAALIESGDGTILLRWSDHAVRIPQEDADAILNQPLAFRAGAIGPDNVMFPGMTDGSHGVEQDPYRQCELLYTEALTEAERAYALGCFLHGASDAVAHHFVNHFTGETFTLNPISAGRALSYDNVVGHIVSESIIQGSIHAADPTRFEAGQLQHALPHDFLLRTYFHTESPVWQRLSMHAMERWEAARAADPEGNVLGWAGSAGFAPWEQIAMSPVYIAELQRLRADLRAWIGGEIADLSDPASARGGELGVTAGPDGVLNTPDDETACTSSCPTLAGQYYVYVNVLAPRYDAGGRELPSAFDVISSGLGDQLYGFLPALVRVIDNLSAVLNAPIPAGDTGDHGFDVSPTEIDALFMPLTDWVDGLVRTTDAGFDGLADAITPGWYRDLSDFLSRLGVDVRIGNVLRLLFGPVIDQIRDTLVQEVRGRAETFITDLTSEYSASRDGWSASIEGALDASAPAELGEHALAQPFDAGLFAYSFNLTAASLANHEVLLVGADPIGSGPASFDASYTAEWTQLGMCEYLREAVFPRGLGLGPLLSVQQGDAYFAATIEGDSPVECHAGSLDAFGTPSVESCAHTNLDALLADPTGSLSRAFPPTYASGQPGCRRLIVPGLPGPPPIPDAGPGAQDGGVVADAAMAGDAGAITQPPEGCGCVAAGSRTDGPWWIALGLLLAWVRRRSFRRSSATVRAAPILLAALLASGCDGVAPPPDVGPRDGGAEDMDAFVPDLDAHVPEADGGSDAGTPMDAGPDPRRQLLDTLADSVWSGTLSRDEGGRLVTRAYEVRFDTRDLRWAEIRNPFGPGRQRVLRSFNPRPDGVTVESTIMIPTGWETPEPLRGRRETWELEIVDGSPRTLVIRDAESGIEETLTEGAWPAPTGGLTAEVRVFGGSGAVYDAFCGTFCGPDDDERRVMWEFARGRSLTPDLGHDVVAGAEIGVWDDGIGDFGITDVHGFDRLGGTELSAQSNFVVRYTGTLEHTGGALWVREGDDELDLYSPDAVEDAVWIFLGENVESDAPSDLALEVHGFACGEATGNEESYTAAAGAVPIEVILVHCMMPFADREMAPMLSVTGNAGPWMLIGDAPSDPVIDDATFPPAL